MTLKPSINNPEHFLGTLNEVERRHAPAELHLAGDASLLESGVRVAVVGSRKASEVGLTGARILAQSLAEGGITVVSGLAEGIDTAAHTEAIASGGRTIAVLGTPLDEFYPSANRELQQRIIAEHLAVSQFASGSKTYRSSFPLRNRTMALISDATVIVEAAERSGTVHQAWEALRLGRVVFLMESLANNRELTWPAKLIHYGAQVLTRESLPEVFEHVPGGAVATRLLSNARYASFLVYAPKAQPELAGRSRRVRDAVKSDSGGIIKLAATRIRERWSEVGLEEFLGPDVLLVPAPRSSPLRDVAMLWPARRICEELVSEGHAVDVAALIKRVSPVPKSAFAPKGKRPTATDHLGSMAVAKSRQLPHRRVTVVDDVVTTGATLLAVASHVAAAWPDAEIRCFALVRELSGEEIGIERLDVPVSGSITYRSETAGTIRHP